MVAVNGVGAELQRDLALADMVKLASFVMEISEEEYVCLESKLWPIPKTRRNHKENFLVWAIA